MKTEESQRFYIFKKVWSRLTNGLFLFTLRNFLTRLGIDIAPYYFEREGLQHCTEVLLKNHLEPYEIIKVSPEQISVMHNIMGLDARKLKQDIEAGQLCMGVSYRKKIVAVIFANFDDFIFKQRKFVLKENQAYIHNLYTFETHRGKGLAPYLRYQCYKELYQRGVNECFSITSYFNKSSLRANQKMNITHDALYLYIGLLKKFHWNFTLKTY